MDADGWITIGTKLDTKDLEKQIRILERNLQKYDKETGKLLKQKVTIEADLTEIEKAKEALKASTDLDLEFAFSDERKQQVLKDYELQMKLFNEGVKQSNQELQETNQKIEQNNARIEKTKENILEIRQQIEQINQNSNIKDSVDNIGSSIQNVTKKVVRWGLAVFGVRSAYSFVRQAMSTLSQYDKQLATDIQYIRFALATTLERVIKPMVEWIFKILQYVNYLTMAWFNLNLFEKATVSSFQQSNKEAKKLQKTLASFDEMNVLNDNSSNDDGGILGPSSDLSKMQDFKPPEWLVWIKDNGELIKNIIIGIGVALAGIKFAKLLTWASGLSGLLGGLATIGVIAIGVELLYTALTGRELISDIMEIKKGLNDLNKIRKEQNNQAKTAQKNTKDLIKTYNDLAETTGVTEEQTEKYVNTLLNNIETDKNLIKSMEEQKSGLGVLTGENKKITKTQQEYVKTINIELEELKKLYNSGKLNEQQTRKYTELLEKQIYTTLNSSKELDKNSKEYQNNAKRVSELKGELESITGKDYKIQSRFLEPDISPIQRVINDLLKGISIPFDFVVGAVGSSGGGHTSGSGRHGAKGLVYYPKLASGGIINMPGRGVPYRGATIGERGAEAVVPLTDSQQMALLGETIGRYITVNATIVNSMNGRILNRELQKIQNQSSFATNGR